MFRKDKKTNESFVDFCHKKFAELDLARKEILDQKETIKKMKHQFNEHEHNGWATIKLRKVEYDSRMDK